jgi:hypothetical protein
MYEPFWGEKGLASTNSLIMKAKICAMNICSADYSLAIVVEVLTQGNVRSAVSWDVTCGMVQD